jgi:hypothetical protein
MGSVFGTSVYFGKNKAELREAELELEKADLKKSGRNAKTLAELKRRK